MTSPSSSTSLAKDWCSETKSEKKLLESCDMHSDIDYSHHLAISDAKGKSVVAEWVDNKMLVAESPLCTNHYLAESRMKDYSIYSEDSHRRYDSMKQMRDSLTTMNQNDVETMKRLRLGAVLHFMIAIGHLGCLFALDEAFGAYGIKDVMHKHGVWSSLRISCRIPLSACPLWLCRRTRRIPTRSRVRYQGRCSRLSG